MVVDDVSFRVAPGEVLGLLGRNGAGKSTLLGMVAGLDRPTGGTVRLLGSDVHARPLEAQAHLGLAAQDVGLYPPLTVRRNLSLFGRLAGADDVATRIEELADWLGLTSLLDRRVAALSGGERRRAHLAAALVHRPTVLLMDEPTTSLDPASRAQLIALVRRLAADGTAVCWSTNQIGEVEELGATVAVLDRGRLIAHGPVAGLLDEHGVATVEVVFAGAAPALNDIRADADGDTLLFRGSAPEVAIAELMPLLDGHHDQIRRMELVGGGLEAVFLTLTGRRFEPDGEGPSVATATGEVAS